jgi:hypothetical protein
MKAVAHDYLSAWGREWSARRSRAVAGRTRPVMMSLNFCWPMGSSR